MGFGSFLRNVFTAQPRIAQLVLDLQSLRGELRAWRARYDNLNTARRTGQLDDQALSEQLSQLFLTAHDRVATVIRESRDALRALAGR